MMPVLLADGIRGIQKVLQLDYRKTMPLMWTTVYSLYDG